MNCKIEKHRRKGEEKKGRAIKKPNRKGENTIKN
jgi:hypothetical protein